jgi:serine/threonine protein kinase
MEALDSTPLREHPPDFKIAGRNASDIYWETRAAVHRLGIQHNDMHVMNILVGKDGKGKIIDMGLSKDNPRAALSEALGAFGRNGGDWQYKRWGSTGGQLLSKVEEGLRSPGEMTQQTPVLAKVVNNKAKVEKEMQNMGLSPSEIREIGATPIRSDDKVYSSGPFAKLDDEKAMRLVNMLYEGV